MKKKHSYLSGFLGIVTALLLLSSCGKYLEVPSNDSLVIPKNLDDLQKLLDNSRAMNKNMGSIGERSADNYFLDQAALADQTDRDRLIYTWSDTHYNFSNDWSAGYTPVYICNLVLERLGKIERIGQNAQDYDRIKGSALFARANQYLSLLWNFSRAYHASTAGKDLGIVLRNSSDMNEKSTRSPVAECYGALLADLGQAAALLPKTGTHVMRPSKGAAFGVLARAYLSMGSYDSAYYYADKLLQIKNDLLDFNNPAEVNLTAEVPFIRFNKEIIAYYEMGGIERALVDSVLYASYEENDLRKQAYFKEGPGGHQGFKGNYAIGASQWESPGLFSGPATGEMYLVRAECSARMGNPEQAQADLNKLLLKRYKTGTFVPYSLKGKDEVLALVLRERRKELVFRGLRWIDIKRLNLEGAGIAQKRFLSGKEYRLEPNANRYALPLPDDIIRLTGMEQNPL